VAGLTKKFQPFFSKTVGWLCIKVSVTTTRTVEMVSVNDFKNIGLRVPYHFEIEGDKNYCKCRYSDRGKVNFTSDKGGSGSNVFYAPGSTQDTNPNCEDGADHPGVTFMAPSPGSIRITFTYALEVTAICESSDGSVITDSKTLPPGPFDGLFSW
jgi:hypothetical protein